MTRPKLFDYYRSSASYRVRIALNLKGVDYDRVSVDLAGGEQASREHLARNPQGFVPMLQAGAVRLTQSLAIIDWLEATHPQPPLLPADPAARAQVLSLALIVACDIHPLNNLRVLKYHSGELGLDQQARSAWYARWVRDGFAALEAQAAPCAGRFLHGDEPGLADICLVPQMYNARRFSVPVDDFPLLVRVDEEANRLAAFANAHPDRVAPGAATG